MEMIFCPNCNKLTGYKRHLGFGTFFAVLLTAGFWLLAIPFYPKRCLICGLTKSASVPWYQTWKLAAVIVLGVCLVLGMSVLMRDLLMSRSDRRAEILKGTDDKNVSSHTAVSKTPRVLHSVPRESTKPVKRPIPIRVDEVTVVPTIHGRNNVQLVKAVLPMGVIAGEDAKLWLTCNDAFPGCIPLRPGMVYWGKAINPGETGFASCTTMGADNETVFCVRIHTSDEMRDEEQLVVYSMGFAKNVDQ